MKNTQSLFVCLPRYSVHSRAV